MKSIQMRYINEFNAILLQAPVLCQKVILIPNAVFMLHKPLITFLYHRFQCFISTRSWPIFSVVLLWCKRWHLKAKQRTFLLTSLHQHANLVNHAESLMQGDRWYVNQPTSIGTWHFRYWWTVVGTILHHWACWRRLGGGAVQQCAEGYTFITPKLFLASLQGNGKG